MRVSLNEIQSAVRKAARGAGWPYALAEDLSKAAAAYAATGGDGGGMSLGLIEDDAQTLVSECLLAFELALAEGGAKAPPTNPQLLSALAISLGSEHGTGFSVNKAGQITKTVPSSHPRSEADTDAAQWRRLNELAMKSYVPASAESRLAGAGAGLTDND